MSSSRKMPNLKLTKKKFKAKSQKVKLFRSDDPLFSVFMWGLDHSISELAAVQVPAMLLPDDFKAFSKIRVDNHYFNREKFPSHYKFKEYCPLVFRKLREHFGIDDQLYGRSFCVPPIRSNSSGRSGAMFVTSRDKQFLGKTMYKEEVETMHQILQKYYQYVVERRAKTLLPHYLGMYRITVENKETYFLIMESVFGRSKIHKKYDLKGSTVDRQVKTKDREKEKEKEKEKRKIEKHPTLKDIDFLTDGVKLFIDGADKLELMEKLKADTDFLCNLNIMDYSLLVGIHEYGREEEESEEEAGDSQDESGEDMESPNDAYGTAESAGDSPQSSPPATPPATPPLTPPPDMATSRPPLKVRTLSQDSNDFLETEETLPDEFFSIACSEGAPQAEKYYLGIIDVLTYYGTKKRTAHAAKTVKHRHNNAEISTVKPENYAKRFLEFMEKAVQ